MVNCSVLGCKSRTQRNDSGITFHSFPSDEASRLVWVSATGRHSWQPTKYSKLCSVHFDDKDFIRKPKTTYLKQYSVPTKHIHASSSKTDDVLKESNQIKPPASLNPGTVLMEVENIAPSYNVMASSSKTDDVLKEANQIKPPASLNPGTVLMEVENIALTYNVMASSSKTDDVVKESNRIKPPASLNPGTVLMEVENIAPSYNVMASSSKNYDIPEASSKPRTPKREKKLREQLEKEKLKSAIKVNKIRALRESKRRLLKKTARLENIITDLRLEMQMKTEDLDLLSNIEVENADFLKRYIMKEKSRKYSTSLRKFALSLHYLSPKAYLFVRKQFDTCLPHPKTLYTWYRQINCEPGFTSESLDAIRLMVKKSSEKIFVCISLDEMSIRQHLQWDGKKTVGYVNIGQNMDTDNLPLAKDALVFMATALNASWKIPVGYFLTNGVNGEQRSALLKNCICLMEQCGVKVVSVTFDGCPANFAMAKNLGAKFDDVNDIDPRISIDDQNLVIVPDACHMLKLVRNTLADKKYIMNNKNQMISWDYLDQLNNLQQNEGLHLANKLRNAHIKYKKQIMKVRLAVQTLSKSVADALLCCKDDLGIESFAMADATIEFIMHFNDIFDILNSRRLFSYGFKKPISRDNFLEIERKLNEFENFVKALKFPEGGNVLKSGRKTGFLGFLIGVKAIKIIYEEYINSDNSVLQYLCTFKLSQDHLELFFSAIRSKGGFNNNPTAMQFVSAYRRLLIHGELKNLCTGNCTPLENINILNCNSTTVCKEISNRKHRLLAMTVDDAENDLVDLPDSHDYIANCELTEFSKEATIYIAGYITRNMKMLIKCEECLGAIVSDEKFPSLIYRKDVGGLHYPSKDVIKICLFAEKSLRQIINIHGNSYFANKNSMPKMICAILAKFIKTDIFDDLSKHINDQDPLDNHIYLLIKAIGLRYLEVRIHHIMNTLSQREEKIRNMHNKLVLFKGQ